MKNHRQFLLVIAIGICGILISTGCGTPTPVVLKPEHESIHISVFRNETTQPAIEERLAPAIISAFQRDGRLRVTQKRDADLMVTGVVKRARVFPVAYSDLDRAIGYNIDVEILVSVLDTNSNEFIFNERPFSASGTFILTSSPGEAETMDVTANLSEQILSALIEGW